MNPSKNESFIIFMVTMAGVGLAIESMLLGWEFWVAPIILVWTAFLWVMKIREVPEYRIREVIYLAYAMFSLLFHGVHSTSFFDVAIVMIVVMVAYSLFGRIYMINLLLTEYAVILVIQYMLAFKGSGLIFHVLNVSRMILHPFTVVIVYYCCVRSINDRVEAEKSDRIKDGRIEAVEADMEDFLSNISHELRTPVNVVNGMSDLLIKRGVGSEADSIKNAGVRLAYQIEDIQDYTECKSESVFLEEDNYMSTSLINDVVTSFRTSDNAGDLDLIVDLDPRTPAMMRGDIKKLHKIFRHLLENAIKFTRNGGIYVRMYAISADYGVNLIIEMTDTGIGMERHAIRAVREGMYQANKKRNRSSGGVGLGLTIVYGFAHRMGGFVKIESERRSGTTVRVTIPQKVVNDTPCLALKESFEGVVLFHVRPDKYKVPKLRDFYRSMASNLAMGVHVPLYAAETVYEVERLKEKLKATHVFMGQDEYEENKGYFEELAKEDIVVTVSAEPGFKLPQGSRVMLMPKPLYAYPVIKILNEGRNAEKLDGAENTVKPEFKDVRALIVDDEPMNLVVATSLFREYGMVIDTAGSGKEAIQKFRENDYDVIFMDHMMPEMDGVEAMKRIREAADEIGKGSIVVALTANVVSGAREMFLKEGFDGFIAKPIDTSDFERVMMRVLSGSMAGKGGEVR